jgi:hypothetical protein
MHYHYSKPSGTNLTTSIWAAARLLLSRFRFALKGMSEYFLNTDKNLRVMIEALKGQKTGSRAQPHYDASVPDPARNFW